MEDHAKNAENAENLPTMLNLRGFGPPHLHMRSVIIHLPKNMEPT